MQQVVYEFFSFFRVARGVLGKRNAGFPPSVKYKDISLFNPS